MANIPAFKNEDDAELFRSIFESTAETYAYYFDVVRNAFFVGFKKDNYQLDGRTFTKLLLLLRINFRNTKMNMIQSLFQVKI